MLRAPSSVVVLHLAAVRLHSPVHVMEAGRRKPPHAVRARLLLHVVAVRRRCGCRCVLWVRHSHVFARRRHVEGHAWFAHEVTGRVLDRHEVALVGVRLSVAGHHCKVHAWVAHRHAVVPGVGARPRALLLVRRWAAVHGVALERVCL